MKNIIPVILFICITQYCSAQSDSIIVYVNEEGKETTKEDAFIYSVYKKQGSLWRGKVYDAKNGYLRSQTYYADIDFKTPVGTSYYYEKDGSVDFASVFTNGRITERTYYYKNGNRKSHITYGDKSIQDEKGWDENGKEIPHFIVEREARLKKGIGAWNQYLQKNLNSDVPVIAGAPAGTYDVIVQFLVNKEGHIAEVKAINVPPNCKPCAAEAVRVIMDGPIWEPAIQNNEPVIYRQRQTITFQVIEEKRKRRRD